MTAPTFTSVGAALDRLDLAAPDLPPGEFVRRKLALMADLDRLRQPEPPVPTLEEVAEQIEEAMLLVKHMAGQFAESPVWASMLKLTKILDHHCQALQQAAKPAQPDTTPVTVEWLEAMGTTRDADGWVLKVRPPQGDIRELQFLAHSSCGGLFWTISTPSAGPCRVWLPTIDDGLQHWQVLWLIRVLKADPTATDEELVRAAGSEAQGG